MKLLCADLSLVVIVVVFLLKFYYSNKVAALAKEDTMKNVNDIDFDNASSSHEGGFDVDVTVSGTTTPKIKVLNNFYDAVLSRGKRFIAFPVGSSFSTAVCLTTGVIGNPNVSYLSMGLNWGIAYDLPNTTWVLQHANGFGPKNQEQFVSLQIKRRHRRDLYGKMETLINSFCVIETFMIILVIYGNVVKLKRTFNVAASENFTTSVSVFVTPHVAVDDNTDVLAINNFDENFFNKNQIIFDTLQHKVHTVNNDLLSLPICDTNTTTICTTSTENSFGKKIKSTITQQKGLIATSDIITNISKSIAKTFMFSTSSSSSSSSSSSLLLQQQRLLSRPKRYLSFPEGSSFSVGLCITVGIIGNPSYSYMSYGLNWGVAYDLPNTTWILNHLHGFDKSPIPVAVWHRRSRRSLYKEIENIIDNMGYNGRDCILRALCESRQYFQKTKMGMIGEMLRVIFSLPKQRIFTRELTENSDIKLYDQAYRRAHSINDCSEQYDCGFSLLQLAFGKYSTPPDGYYTKH